jgi:dipeptidyl aminopeptidase/acylaminoacyl peptidase
MHGNEMRFSEQEIMYKIGRKNMRGPIIFIILAILLMPGCIAAIDESKEQLNSISHLIPKDMLFGNPDRTMVRISSDGSNISYLAPTNGVLNVWVAPFGHLDKARPVTNDTYRGIHDYSWAYTNKDLLYLQDKGGNENYSLYSVNLSSGEVRGLTPLEGVQASIIAESPKFPHECVISLNKRDPEYSDLYKLNITTGNLTLLMENKEFMGFDVDNNLTVRLAYKMTPEGGEEIYRLTKNVWELFQRVGRDDLLTIGTWGFNKNNDQINFIDSRDRNTAALFSMNLSTGKETLIAEDAKADFSDALVSPTEKNVQAVAFTYDRKHWKVIDSAIAGDLDYLRKVADGDVEVMDRTLDDKVWIVAYLMDNGPVRYYSYDRGKIEAKFMFTNREKLEGQPLAKMIPVVIKSRDNLSLVSYYTLPLGTDQDNDGRPYKPVPLVLYVHGGPWDRDEWGFDPVHQWLANRGYAVLSVNYRESTGFGKNFTNAGNLEWGRKMQEDLIDAVNWSINQGIADPQKIAIMGGSYGGYAALAGLTFTPTLFACGVDICGPSNLTSLIESFPPNWRPELELWTSRVGDYRTEEGKKLLKERSPLNFADRIQRPLLIGQGANDPRVRQNESDQIVRKMQAKNLSVTYLLYSDEGHGFARPENKLSFYAVAEAFLSKHLGGRCEPVGNDFNGSTIAIPGGADEIPGLAQALQERL